MSDKKDVNEFVKKVESGKFDKRSVKLGHKVKVEVEGQEYSWPSKSAGIVGLAKMGLGNSEIAELLGIRYQFVYNVRSKYKV